MYRTLDTDTWDDPWFADLPAPSKLLFLYFVTNRRTTPAGVFEITERAMAFETGLDPATIAAALPTLAPKVQWWPELRVVWVRNFYKRQRANSNDKFTQSARKALAQFPVCVQDAVGVTYPDLAMGGMSHPNPIPIPPHRDGDNETVTVTVTEQYTPPTPPPVAPPTLPPDAADAAGADQARKPTPVPKATDTPNYQDVFTAIATHYGLPRLPWNFGREAKALNVLLKTQPRAAPGDLIAFLDYLQSVWPWSGEPTRLPKFSDAQTADHWPQWWARGRPTSAGLVSRNGTQGPQIAIVKSWD